MPKFTRPLKIVADRSFASHPLYPVLMVGCEKIAKDMGWLGVEVKTGLGGVMNACSVLEEEADCYCKLPCEEPGGGGLWDFSATACLFAEAGFISCDIFGHRLDLNRKNSTFMNHRGVLLTHDKTLATSI